MLKYSLLVFCCIFFYSCSNNDDVSDAYGNFEATEYLISSEVDGKLLSFDLEEGQDLDPGQIVGQVDTSQLFLKREQLIAQKGAIKSRLSNIFAQVAVLHEQKETAMKDKKRIDLLFKENAATQKEIDDINGRISVIDKQIESIETQNSTIFSEVRVLDTQIAQLDDLLEKCLLRNPEKGTVISKYIERNEIVGKGKPLYKIADLSTLTLKAYFSGDQLSDLSLSQKVKVLVDNKDAYKEFEGVVSWISPKAEFTPKIIQTKDERANMVYAVKIRVENDGSLNIGMPGEVRFYSSDKEK